MASLTLPERRLHLAQGCERQCRLGHHVQLTSIHDLHGPLGQLTAALVPSQLTLGQGLDRQSEDLHDGRSRFTRDSPWTTHPSPG